MTSDIPSDCLCARSHRVPHVLRDRSLGSVADSAQRLQALLEAADILTEKPELTEMDIIALDVLLDAGRDYASDIVRRIGHLPGAVGDAGAVPHQ